MENPGKHNGNFCCRKMVICAQKDVFLNFPRDLSRISGDNTAILGISLPFQLDIVSNIRFVQVG